MATSLKRYDPALVRQTIAALMEPGGVFEVRCLGAKIGRSWKSGIASGYFDSVDGVFPALESIEASGIYITLNPVNPDLLARRCRRIDYAEKDATTKDGDITRRRWMLVDIDPTRPSGISSTDEEKKHAERLALSIREWLTGRGWTQPLAADSGNGWHLLYRVDLATDDNKIVQRCLKALANRFDDESCKVDVTTFNPARITKLYGTIACKGDSTPTRPHRMSRIVAVKGCEVVTNELLEALAGEAPSESAKTSAKDVTKSRPTATRKAGSGLDLSDVEFIDKFIARHEIAIRSHTTKAEGVEMWTLESCPFDAGHGGNGEVALFRATDGRLGFKCFHNGCAGKDWKAFRQHYDPGCYDRDPLQEVLDDDRVKIRLPGPNRILSAFATELGQLLASKDIYLRNKEVVALEGHELHPVKPQEFRTLSERYANFYRLKKGGDDAGPSVQYSLTMTNEDASGVLASPQFREQLRPIRQVHDCGLPVMRRNGAIELLPSGYDPESRTLTLPAVEYSTETELPDAKAVVTDLFGEFTFVDEERSLAVAVAGMLALYARHLLPALTDRPSFVTTANAEGAGKGLINALMIIPVLGRMPVSIKAKDEDEMRKFLSTAVRDAAPVVFLDNLKCHLNSSALEAFLTASEWRDRLLGSNETITGTVLTTGS